MNGTELELRRKIERLQSQVDRLDGKLEGILEGVQGQAKSIQKLQDKQSRLDGLRSQLS